MLPYQMIAGGNFTLESITQPVDLELISMDPPDMIWLRNRSAWGDLTENTQIVEYLKRRGMAQGTVQGTTMTTGSGALSTSDVTIAPMVSDGISTYDTANPPVFAGLTAGNIDSMGGTYVVTMGDTGTIAVGDYVRLFGTTAALQLSTISYQVTAVSLDSSITLGYMATGGVTTAADATEGTVLKYIPSRFYPRRRFVANITQAAQAVVYFTEKNDFTPGEIITFRVTSDFGMEEINNRAARVLSVTNSATESSVTIDLDTSGFTAFDFPTSVNASDGFTPAMCLPASSGVVPFNAMATVPQQPPGTNLLDAFDNRNTRVIHLGASMWSNDVGDAAVNDIWDWYAMKFDLFLG